MRRLAMRGLLAIVIVAVWGLDRGLAQQPPAAPQPAPLPETAAPSPPAAPPAPPLGPPPGPPSSDAAAPPPHALQPASPAGAAAPPPPVVAAEQVAPAELTGLLGHDVVNAGGSGLGRIVDLLVDGQGQVRAVVMDVGGFLGVGTRKVAVAWSALRFASGAKEPVISIAIPLDRIRSWAEYIPGRPVAILGTSGPPPNARADGQDGGQAQTTRQ